MGKRESQTLNTISESIKPIEKQKIKRTGSLREANEDKLKIERDQMIISNVLREIKNLVERGEQNNKRKLQSVLKIYSEKELQCSAIVIPSIENLIPSANRLCSEIDPQESFIDSRLSILENYPPKLMVEEPELLLTYICLIEKAISNIGMSLSPKQNEKLVQGIWNLLIKFEFDNTSDLQYESINSRLEWGILELLNFDLTIKRKERVLKESIIRHTL